MRAESAVPGDADAPNAIAQADGDGAAEVPVQPDAGDTSEAPPAGPAPTKLDVNEPAGTKLDVSEATDREATDREATDRHAITGFPEIQKNGLLLGNRYRLNERIAIGGMGQVWRATDELLGRAVAVKLLSARHAADEQFRTRFQAEARYAASLSHRGIARVYDYGESGEAPGAADAPGSGVPYLVMELVEGEPLSAAIARDGRMPADVTLDIVAQSARALAAAHAAGIVHRDIKPGNLLLTPERQVKITDFGIARAAMGAHLTQTGMVMGTAQYVSPEQASARPVTAASDVYSLGVVAYECLAGHPPFTAEAPIALALAHVNKQPPPLPDDVPAGVAALVGQMLAKDPEARPASANVVADRATALRAAPSGPHDGQDRWLTGPAELASPATWFADPTPTTPAQSQDGPGTPGGTAAAAAVLAARPWRRRVAQVLSAAAVVLAAAVGILLALTMGKPGASQHHGHDAPHHPVAVTSRKTSKPAGYQDAGNVGPGRSPTPDPTSKSPSPAPASSSPASPTASSSPSPTKSASQSPTPPPASSPPPTSPPPSSPPPTSPPPQVSQAGSQTANVMTQDG